MRVVPQRGARLVRFERELATLGFFIPVGHRIRHESPRHVRLIRTVSSKRCEFSISIIPSREYGFPVISDQDKYLAFLDIICRHCPRKGTVRNPITFHTTELLAILGRHSKGGRHHQRIRDWLGVMTGTTILSEGAVWLAGGNRLLSGPLRVFDRAVASGETTETDGRAGSHRVWLSEWQLENLNHGHSFPIDLDSYLALRKHISRSLVPPLHVWLFASRHSGRFEKSYEDLCRLLCMRQYHRPSQIIEKLEPSFDELHKAGYLSGLELQRTGDDYKLVFHPGERFQRHADRKTRPAASEAFRAAVLLQPGANANLLSELTRRGIAEPFARKLLAGLAQGQEVMNQLEWGDFLIRTRPAIGNPAGFYIHLIRENVTPPGQFETTERKLLHEERRRAREIEGSRRAFLQIAYEAYREREVADHISKQVTPEEYQLLVDQKRKELRKRCRNISTWKPETLDTCLRSAVTAEIEARLPLLSFDQFCQQENYLIEKGETERE